MIINMAEIADRFRRLSLSCILVLLLLPSSMPNLLKKRLHGPETNWCLFSLFQGGPGMRLSMNELDIATYLTPKSTIMISIAKQNDTSVIPGQPCLFPMQEVHATFDIFNNTSSQGNDIFFEVLCIEPTEVILVNDKNYTNKNINVTLSITSCQMDLESVGVIGDMFRLIGLFGIGWSTRGNTLSTNTSMSVISGLQSLWYISITASVIDLHIVPPFIKHTPEDRLPLPKGLSQTYLGSLLVLETMFIDIDEDLFGNFSTIMPNLKLMKLFEVNVSSIPVFPWKKSGKAPLGDDRQKDICLCRRKQTTISRGIAITGSNIGNLENYQFDSSLETIEFTNDAIDKIGSRTFSEVHGLRMLLLRNNLLTAIPEDAFKYLRLLKKLDLAGNQLKFLHPKLFISQGNLEELDLSFNLLKEINGDVLIPLTSMKYLLMSHNDLRQINNDINAINFPGLISVDLSNNRLTAIPKWLLRARLSYANLTCNRLTSESLISDVINHGIKGVGVESVKGDFYAGKVNQITIDLLFNNITSFNLLKFISQGITYADISMTFLSYILNIGYENITCDCRMYDTKMVLFVLNKLTEVEVNGKRGLSLRHNDWKCLQKRNNIVMPLLSVPLDEFMCNTNVSICPSSCDCYKMPFDDSILVNCSARDLSSLPVQLPMNVSILLISSNKVQVFDVLDIQFYPTLKVLDLSKNDIRDIRMSDTYASYIDKLDILYLHENNIKLLPSAFTKLSHVNITLTGNRLVCDCNSRWLPEWLQGYYKHISDVNEIQCFPPPNRNIPLRYMDGGEFKCEIPAAIIIGSSLSAAFIFLVIVFIILYKFRGEIKLILYMKFKWRPFDKDESVDITDKEFDAFISYSNLDKEWVIDTLVPKLEEDGRNFSLCFDERNFLPGNIIIDNIANALKDSRRMIMVLTNNFLNSVWCKFEFQNAHKRVLEERTNYLIVVMADDVKFDDLDEGMKLYVRTNTYISISSPWLWERLLYSMPLKSIGQLQLEQIDDDNANIAVDPLNDIPLV